MTGVRIVERGALDCRRPTTSPQGPLPEALEVIKCALSSCEKARADFPGYRLTRLVGARIELDQSDMDRLSNIIGIDLLSPIEGVLRPFDHHLRQIIDRYGLEALFADDGHAPYHHAIRPTGYDFHRDEVHPTGMERWRADYRAMSDVKQMMAASIIWLYRAGKDNVWLRRVPCTWHAADAIACLRESGALEDWARLYALYPGW
ncbi:MAG: hypothetical protein DI595_01195 [Agrobacterium fabrum]|uniref:Uncharacterized protein n=1 Tax=Agrobacterium fabrum TaxID=1176649 RepID=A0A2W5HEV3_9HYPH|nr:MAG: hypothetical protein DI595_01195 [Agrobacterium fabrum]